METGSGHEPALNPEDLARFFVIRVHNGDIDQPVIAR
jgi:hypothetical protein